MKRISVFMIVLLMLVVITSAVSAVVNAVTPSTNEINKTKGWAHVDEVSKGVGTVALSFVSTRGFASCFEYRSDGDVTQKTSNTNYNTSVTDGLYPFFCVNNSTKNATLFAYEYVEIRMVFGAETDERFDWTRFDVIPIPANKEQCKDDGWMAFTGPDGLPFANQGKCIQFVLAGK